MSESASKSQRLPPGQSLSSELPTLHYGPIPAFNPATWDFRIWGAVEEPVVWTWDQILDLPRVKIRLDLHCVTSWSMLDTEWEGVSPKALVELGLIKPKPEARFVMQHADFGYTTNLPLAVVLQENFLLATHYSGEPLAPEHGYPLRGVIGSIPGHAHLKDVYLWKGAKWLRGLEFMTEDRLGFWEANGYHNQGDVWKEQRRSE
jgi:DMSO/TMAO reductase YedYZ molybdopterin-dependent catalytic subunit